MLLTLQNCALIFSLIGLFLVCFQQMSEHQLRHTFGLQLCKHISALAYPFHSYKEQLKVYSPGIC